MSDPRTVPYGAWPSPISAARAARASLFLSEVRAIGDATTWCEMRPAEDGRYVVVRAEPGGPPHDITPAGYSARSRVHEYGGGAYTVFDALTYFVNDADQRVYRQDIGVDPVPITPEPASQRALRYADMDVSPDGGRIACVRERHAGEGLPENELVILSADGTDEPRIAASGRDFYAFPRWSPDGRRLAFLEWGFPQMPWDGTELVVAEVDEAGAVRSRRQAAGGQRESIFQPSWAPDGRLFFISDRTGWWNLFEEALDGTQTNLTPMAAEFGGPMWEFGYSTYGFLSDGRIACQYRREGVHHLAILDPVSQEMIDLDVPYTTFDHYLSVAGQRLAFVAGGPVAPLEIVTLDFSTRAIEVLRSSDDADVDPGYVSEPEAITFPTTGGRNAFAYAFAPANRDAVGPENERPPLIVHVHGGPTSEMTPELDLRVQFFTSRGFAYVDVNYGGSTGHGRAFRESLYGQWGVIDVDDAIAAARSLIDRGLADPERVVITGGSAGGWTALCALAFRDAFAAGTSYYGVSDLEPFATFTHKFEFKYTDVLVGPWPDAKALWAERSPVRHADRISRPLLILQGDEDEVVPPSQAEIIVEALEARGLPYAYILFDGEQHGFRKVETIARALEAELAFYCAILGFRPADALPPLEISNLPG